MHETGHYFGLQHTFSSSRGACSEGTDDGVEDTPLEASPNYACNTAVRRHPRRAPAAAWQYEYAVLVFRPIPTTVCVMLAHMPGTFSIIWSRGVWVALPQARGDGYACAA